MAIAEIAQDCLAAFNQLKAQGGTPCTVDEVEDIFGRFRLWVSNVSAHSSGTRSLLYRLRDNTRLSNSVENYLQDLGTLLQSGKSRHFISRPTQVPLITIPKPSSRTA